MFDNINFELERYRIYCEVLSVLLTKKWLGKRQREKLIYDLEVLRSGLIPLKFL